ncbi:UDP-galactose transporter senju-like [Branchiostoma lanceolatum]|uniref:UDP-galactose transporter senju-like n=1 Tax=Branchiostoma lanceolatum TaxID=7740 RepID=UPI003451DC19
MAGWRPQFVRGWHFSKLFPTKWSVVVFLAYMTVFINQGILVTASRTEDNTYPYNTVALVMVTEVLKLLVATMLYLKDNTFKELVRVALRDKRVLLLYLVPALLYCLYNNLQFVNLAVYDPTTYYLLLQFRVVITGVIFQVLFKKTLSRLQWLSLLLLTVGCVIKHMKYDTHVRDVVSFGSQSLSVHLNASLLNILLQVFCSCFAGVYTEFLLKGEKSSHVPFMMQNVFMYLDSIMCNVCVLAFTGDLLSAFTTESINSILQPAVMLVILNQTAIGIITSLFLMSFNSILKTFASALELMFTAVLCWYIFGIPIDIFTFISIVIVCLATFLYSLNPVVVKTSTRHTSGSCDSKQNGFVV